MRRTVGAHRASRVLVQYQVEKVEAYDLGVVVRSASVTFETGTGSGAARLRLTTMSQTTTPWLSLLLGLISNLNTTDHARRAAASCIPPSVSSALLLTPSPALSRRASFRAPFPPSGTGSRLRSPWLIPRSCARELRRHWHLMLTARGSINYLRVDL